MNVKSGTLLIPPNSLARTKNECSIFVGNFSIFCNEANLYQLFSQFGPIASIRLKKSDMDPQRAHLSYGFIDYCFQESIEEALKMNNTMFFGRALRVGRADHRNHRKMKEATEAYNPTTASFFAPAISSTSSTTMTTAQVHVTFTVHSLDALVSEVTLREIFNRFGHLLDVVIKKNVAYDDLGLQSGYGFIHYGLDDKGIESALRAVEMMNHRHLGGVMYECSLTHGLKTFLFSLNSKRFNHQISEPNIIGTQFSSKSTFNETRYPSLHSIVSLDVENSTLYKSEFPVNPRVSTDRRGSVMLYEPFTSDIVISNPSKLENTNQTKKVYDGMLNSSLLFLAPN